MIAHAFRFRWLGLRQPRCEPYPFGISCLEGAFEVVEGSVPAVVVGAYGLLVQEAAVGEADGGDAVGFLEVQLDELPRGAAVPDPGEREARRRVDLGVVAAAAVLDVLVWVAHDHAHDAADAQVDLGLGRLPIVLGVEPAAEHLLARPRVEDSLGGRLVGTLNAQRRGVGHVPGAATRPSGSGARGWGSTTRRAESAGSPRGSPPIPPAVRAP